MYKIRKQIRRGKHPYIKKETMLRQQSTQNYQDTLKTEGPTDERV